MSVRGKVQRKCHGNLEEDLENPNNEIKQY